MYFNVLMDNRYFNNLQFTSLKTQRPYVFVHHAATASRIPGPAGAPNIRRQVRGHKVATLVGVENIPRQREVRGG
jgi:hypothetical protein